MFADNQPLKRTKQSASEPVHLLRQKDQELSKNATAGLDVQYEPTKNQFANEPEGLR